MCLAVPGRITDIDGTTAQVDFGGITRDASLVLVPDAAAGDYVLVHAGFAIEVLNEDEAAETLELFRDLARALDDDASKEGVRPPAQAGERESARGEDGAGEDGRRGGP